jgi:hypothetical protein
MPESVRSKYWRIFILFILFLGLVKLVGVGVVRGGSYPWHFAPYRNIWIHSRQLPHNFSPWMKELPSVLWNHLRLAWINVYDQKDPWELIFVIFGAAYAVEELGFFSAMITKILPATPEFLAWPNTRRLISPWNLKSSFNGRSMQCTAIYSWLEEDCRQNVRGYGLYGTKGVGKTRIAVECMASLRMMPWAVPFANV